MTPLVLLPGMMCDAGLVSPQIAALSGAHAIHCAPVGGHEPMGALAAEVLAHAPYRFALWACRWAASWRWRCCGRRRSASTASR